MFFLVRGHKGFKFRIYPSAKQQERLLRWESALRFLWNLALEQRKLGLRQRYHILHTLSAAYAKSHGTVVVKRLQTVNMLRNRRLARRIANAGWSRLVELLRYKLAWSGGRLVEVPALQLADLLVLWSDSIPSRVTDSLSAAHTVAMSTMPTSTLRKF